MMDARLPKSERLCGFSEVAALMERGERSGAGCLRCRFMPNSLDYNRILVSVPKRFFKRAVKRNLLKRRLREAYRTQKSILGPSSTDILFLYNSKEINDFQTIKEEVAEILKKVADERQL